MGLFDTAVSTLDAGFSRIIEPTLSKAQTRPPGSALPALGEAQDPMSIFHDPYELVNSLGFRDKPSQTTYGTLRHMARRCPPVGAAFGTRVYHQISGFGRPQKDEYSIGFAFEPRDRSQKMTPALEKEAREAEQWLMTTGFTEHPEAKDNFETFLKKFMWDSMVYDQGTFEIVPDYEGAPAAFYATDGATYRIADQRKLHPDHRDMNTTRWVQVYDETVVNEFKMGELAFCVRRPRTDIRLHGYGTPELEDMIQTVTAFLWGYDYNKNAFSQGTLQKGLLNLKGQMNKVQFRAFRRHWYTTLAGAHNAHRTAILNAPEGAEWIPMTTSARDMEFSNFMDFLLKMICAFLGMHPSEVNFEYGLGQRQRPMFEGNNKARLVESKDRGLKPLLRFLADEINKHLIWKRWPNLTLTFAGLNARSPEEEAELDDKRNHTSPLDEIRESKGKKPLGDENGGFVINNPAWIAWFQAKKQKEQMQMQQQMQEEQGAMMGQGATGQEPAGDDGDGDDDDSTLAALGVLDEEEDDTEKSMLLMDVVI